jgi:hypothetical protein
LLRGDANLSELVGRAEPFGLDLTRAHQVALAQPGQRLPSIAAATSALERVVLDRFGDRDVLVATKDGLVVVIALAEATGAPDTSMGLATTGSLGKTVHSELSRLRRGSPWRVAIGRAHPGAYGIARSYEEAREGLTMAARMHLDSPIVETRDLLTYRVLARDQPALNDLVYSVLHPLRQARGGAGPLVETLAAYFDCGCVATAAAARLHLSVRAVTYRLDRVRSLTGFDPLDPAHRYTLQTAVLGAKLLDWPERRIPDSAASSSRWQARNPAGVCGMALPDAVRQRVAGRSCCRSWATAGNRTSPGAAITGPRRLTAAWKPSSGRSTHSGSEPVPRPRRRRERLPPHEGPLNDAHARTAPPRTGVSGGC